MRITMLIIIINEKVNVFEMIVIGGGEWRDGRVATNYVFI